MFKAARLFGKEEGRVRIPDGPSMIARSFENKRAARPMVGRLAASRKSGFNSPAVLLNSEGLVIQREDTSLADWPVFVGDGASSILGESIEETEGSRIRLAGPLC